MSHKDFIEIPARCIPADENGGILSKVGSNWEAYGYYTIRKSNLPSFSQKEWEALWKRYPGPSTKENLFYTKDSTLVAATEEQIRNSLKVVMVEEELEGENNE